MNNQMAHREQEGRPYRSHLHPACFSCKKRKSRCKTQNSSGVCMMCQAHGTECVFPRPDDVSQRRAPLLPRKSPASTRQRFALSRIIAPHQRPCAIPHTMPDPAGPGTICPDIDPGGSIALVDPPQMQPASVNQHTSEGLPNLAGIVSEAGDNSSHIVSPAVADDNEILERYLSAAPAGQRCLVRTSPSPNRPLRPVRFNAVPRRPLGVAVNQSLAASKCEVIEKYMGPDIDEYLNLCVFPIQHFYLVKLFLDPYDTLLDSFKRPIHASQYLTRRCSEVHTLLTERICHPPYSATYTPTPLSIGAVHLNYAPAALPIFDLYGIKPTRLYIRSYFCHRASQQ